MENVKATVLGTFICLSVIKPTKINTQKAQYATNLVYHIN